MSKRLWILGASDPEMSMIEELLAEVGEEFVHATVGGRRVHAGNAYQADPMDMSPTVGENSPVVYLVECGPSLAGHDGPVVVIDHHRHGDPGYGRGPEEFFSASSIGQTMHFLGIIPTEEQRLVAAADHCLAAAYAGKCPGVDPDKLQEFRAAQRGEYLRGLPADRPERIAVAHWHRHLSGDISLDTWTKSVRATWAAGETDLASRPMARLELAPEPEDWGEDTEAATARYILVRDLRGRVLPEAPEVLAQAGEAGIYLLPAQGDRPAKVGILGAGEGTLPGTAPVEAFLAAARCGEVAGTSVKPETAYGDPARGYAGVEVAD